MKIDRFRHEDIDQFLVLAAAEGWVCERWEFEFLLEAFPGGCLVAREGGGTLGYITAIGYETSGWIGNLIVSSCCRGQGVGTMLMESALAVLDGTGRETVWLTASRQGKPIYERLGFAAVDVINRWVGNGLLEGNPEPATGSRDDILAIDSAGWGDRRVALIDAVARRGKLLSSNGAFLFTQQCPEGIQFGPWGGSEGYASALLDDALLVAGKGVKVLLDVPIRNTVQTALLLGRGFAVRGSALLMYRGVMPTYVPERIWALASMGSMG